MTPPAIEWGLGLSADVVVAVPASLVDIYKAAPGWSALNIMPISPHTEYDEVAIEGILYRYDANSGGYMVVPQSDDPESNYNNLSSAIIPESITVIDTPYTVTGIAANAFAGSRISSISLPSSIKSIPEGCFSNCRSLTQVTIPENVISIGNNAFALCSGITKITVEAMTPPVLGNDVFPAYVITNATLTVYKSALENYENAPVWKDFKINAIEYYKYVKVGDLTFRCHPDSMTASVYQESDDESNYSGFGGETITIPETVTCDNENFTVTSISRYAFMNAVIGQLNIPSTITSFESGAFLRAKISKVDIPSLEQWIDIFDNKVYDSPFDPYNPGILLIEGEPLTKVTIEPASKINSSTFYGCSGITTLEIADKVSRFETSYLWAEEITDLILGADLTNISKEAVANMTNIKRIISKNLEAPSIPANSFAKDVAKSATLYLSPFVGSSYYYNGSYNAQGWWVFSDKIKYFDLTLESYPDFVIGRQKLEGLSLTLANKDFSGELIIPKVINSPRGNLSVISFDGLEGCSEVTSIEIPESLEQIATIERSTSL
ncbi:MAG: leucine-rich repeat domain-containing protein, partial [Muribaculaceae bacterium]|nr:leucine-rich repeat domain-containing protein [Muribaculaceae bacterium]